MAISKKYKKIQHYLQERSLDLAFFQNPASVLFLTGFEIDPHERIMSLMVPAQGCPMLFVPFLETEAAKRACADFTILSYQDHENPWELMLGHFEKEATAYRWAVEKNSLTLQSLEAIKQILPTLEIKEDCSDFINQLRVIKDPHEVELLKQSGNYADKAVQIGIEALEIGITEVEVVAKIEYEMKKLGIRAMSFDTMVLFGDHAADPHGVPGNRTLQENEFVLFDLGTMHQGYASDMTRTVFFGSEMTAHQKEIYEITKTAHDKAIAAIKPGMKACEIDQIARDYIKQFGYGEYFMHRLGHGIGQSCHEFPSIMEGNDMILEVGMCFSVEPGIYLPNDIGVRVEDCGVITETGFELFTHFPNRPTIK